MSARAVPCLPPQATRACCQGAHKGAALVASAARALGVAETWFLGGKPGRVRARCRGSARRARPPPENNPAFLGGGTTALPPTFASNWRRHAAGRQTQRQFVWGVREGGEEPNLFFSHHQKHKPFHTHTVAHLLGRLLAVRPGGGRPAPDQVVRARERERKRERRWWSFVVFDPTQPTHPRPHLSPQDAPLL